MMYVSPMSVEIVAAATQVKGVGFVATRNQVDTDAGYVMRTHELAALARCNGYAELCRDHAWPELAGLCHDIDCGFNILHIDPFIKEGTMRGAADLTVDAMQRILKTHPNVFFEIGTERRRFPYDSDHLYEFLKYVHQNFDFPGRVRYAVVQGGTLVRDGANENSFDGYEFGRQVWACQQFGMYAKEHNCDWLTDGDLQRRIDLGLSAFNVGPELIRFQNEFILLGMNPEELAVVRTFCEAQSRWKEWTSHPELAAPLTLHYFYNQEPVRSIVVRHRDSFQITMLLAAKIAEKKEVFERGRVRVQVKNSHDAPDDYEGPLQ